MLKATLISISLILIVVTSIKIPLENSLISNAQPSLSLSESNHFDDDFQFHPSIEIYIGTPPQKMSLILSTASSITWIFSNKDPSPISKSFYNPIQSSTFFNTSKKVFLNSNIDQIKAFIVEDKVSLSYPQDNSLRGHNSESKTFLAVDFEKSFSETTHGVIGLGLNSLPSGASSFTEILQGDGDATQKPFSFRICGINLCEFQSEFVLGREDNRVYERHQVIRVNSGNKNWISTLEFMFVNENRINTESLDAIFDTNSSYILLPSTLYKEFSEVMKKFNSNCNGERKLVCSCTSNDFKNYPTLKFSFNDKTFLIHSENYVYYAKDNCYLLVKEHQKSYMVVGFPFFVEHHTVFDMSNRLIKATPYPKVFLMSKELKEKYVKAVFGIIIALSLLFSLYHCCTSQSRSRSENTSSFNPAYINIDYSSGNSGDCGECGDCGGGDVGGGDCNCNCDCNC